MNPINLREAYQTGNNGAALHVKEINPAVAVNSLESLENSVKILGLPAVLKTSRMGYDGKGQAVIRAEGEIENAFNSLTGSKGNSDCDLVLEGFIDFSMEISVIVARDIKGNIACYCPSLS